MTRSARRRASAWAFVLSACCAALLGGCAGSDRRTSRPVSEPTYPERRFAYVAIDGSRFDTASTTGRYTVVLFLATYDISSQLAARQLEDLFRGHVPRINAGAVVLEPPRNAPLVEAFASALSLSYPVVLADHATIDGHTTFGKISTIPTYVVLDPEGREISRIRGWARPEVIEGKLP